MSQRPSKSAKGKASAAGTAATQRHSRFLKLALELRENVFRHVLREAPASLFDLSVTSRQLSREVKPFLYRQPLTFNGQNELFQWLTEVDRNFVHHVLDLRFRLHDIDPDRIVGALGKRLQQANITRASGSRGPDTEDNPYFEACHLDLKRLLSAFRLLPNVQYLTILPATAEDPQPHPKTREAFSKLLGLCFPNVISLTSEENEFATDFLSAKSRLRRLQFPATTTSADSDTAKFARSLPLIELDIYRHEKHARSAMEETGCITATLANVKPLRSLTLLELPGRERPSLAVEAFLESHTALRRHQISLRALKLLAKPGQSYGDMLHGEKRSPIDLAAAFLESSSLTHVEYIDSWSLIYEHLPVTTRYVAWHVEWPPPPSRDSLAARIKSLVTRALKVRARSDNHNLPNLGAILIYLSPRSLEDPEDAEMSDEDDTEEPDEDEPTPQEILMAAKSKLRKIGINFAWRIQESPERFY